MRTPRINNNCQEDKEDDNLEYFKLMNWLYKNYPEVVGEYETGDGLIQT